MGEFPKYCRCTWMSTEPSFQAFDRNISEHHRVVMTGKTEISFGPILPRMWGSVLEFGHFRQVSVENDRTIQLDLDLRTDDGHFFVIPLANRPQITAMRRDHSIRRPVILPRIEFGVHLGVVVENLQFAHARQMRLTFTRVANRQAVVSTRRELEFNAYNEIIVLVRGK